MDDRQIEQHESDRRTAGLAGLALMLALALAALFLFQHLKRAGDLQDCLFAGRTNCDALIDK